jgi:hypothetical protein
VHVFRPERAVHQPNALCLDTIPTIALSGRLFGVLHYPPRCGGLLRIALIRAKNTVTLFLRQ